MGTWFHKSKQPIFVSGEGRGERRASHTRVFVESAPAWPTRGPTQRRRFAPKGPNDVWLKQMLLCVYGRRECSTDPFYS